MILTINLPIETVKKLEALAKEHGQAPTEYAAYLLENQVEAHSAVLPGNGESSGVILYPLRGSTPYSYQDPFEPAIPVEEWDVS